MRFSFRYKFLAVITILLLFCVTTYLYLAFQTYREDKKELVIDVSTGAVIGIASEFEIQFQNLADKLTIFTLFSQENPQIKEVIAGLIHKESDLVYISIAEPKIKTQEKQYVNSNFLKSYDISEDFFQGKLIGLRPIPFEQIQQKGEAIWNASVQGGPPLIGYGLSLVKESADGKRRNHVAVISYMHPEKLLTTLSGDVENEISVINSAGEVLLHTDQAMMFGTSTATPSPLVKTALNHPLNSPMVSEFVWKKKKMFGAFKKGLGGNIIVLSQVPEEKVYSAVIRKLARRSFAIGVIILCIAFMAAILLSRSLTKPLAVLIKGMDQVGQGDLETHIDVRSRDEMKKLADSFNDMIGDLKKSRFELEEMNRDLEKKVKERTIQLEKQNQAVKEAQETLLKTSRLAAVGEIAGRAAHEVLNPLTSLMTRVQRMQRRLKEGPHQDLGLLCEIQSGWESDYKLGGFDKLVEVWNQKSEFDEKQTLWQEDINNIENVRVNIKGEVDQLVADTSFLLNEGQRINKIVNNMRSLTTVRGEKKPIPCSLALKESLNIMADLFEQGGVQIITDYCKDKDIIYVDRDEFIQSITNLLRNAYQAVASVKQDGFKGHVKVKTFVENQRVGILIEDNGEGISQENQEKLFNKQFSTKPIDEGTGLGLGISRRFIRAFNGDIQFVKSIPLESTIFKLDLPLWQEDMEAA